jgi:cell division protein FtsB
MTPKSRRRLIAKIFIWSLLTAGFLLLLLEARATWHVYQKEREAKTSYDLAAESYAGLIEREKTIGRAVNGLNTTRGLEEVVRTRYPLAKPGEEVIVLVDSKKQARSAENATTTSFWQSLKSWFLW